MARLTVETGFIESAYLGLLGKLKSACYRFADYGEAPAGRHVIWRHDVAFSMHRAARLAEIEKARGVRATYFVNPRSAFYNLLEADVAAKTSVIKDCGHEIGLHFDAPAPADGTWTQTALETALTKEKALLEAIIERPVRCVSWRNLDQSTLQAFDDDQIAGLQNGDSARLRRDYVHCSDTNGYWRFAPMAEVIAAGHERLHLLTDPVWWTDAPMAPSARIHRAIFGRALAVRRAYDALAARSGRQNRDF